MLSNISIQSQQYVIKYLHTLSAVCYQIYPYSRSSMLSNMSIQSQHYVIKYLHTVAAACYQISPYSLSSMLSNISIQSQENIIKYVHTVSAVCYQISPYSRSSMLSNISIHSQQYVIKYLHTVATVCYQISPYSRSTMLSNISIQSQQYDIKYFHTVAAVCYQTSPYTLSSMLSNISIQLQQYVIKYLQTVAAVYYEISPYSRSSMLSNMSIQSQQYVIKYLHTVAAVCYQISPYSRSSMLSNISIQSQQYVIKYLHTVAAVCYPAEEGKTAMLSCVISTASCPNGVVTLTWQAEAASEHVIECSLGICTSFYGSSFSATYTSTLSTLTIRNVSRVDPFNMETRWYCEACGQTPLNACDDKLQIFYIDPLTVWQHSMINTESGDISSFTYGMETTKVYPPAIIDIYFRRTDSQQGYLSTNLTSAAMCNHTEVGSGPVYYTSECWVTVPVDERSEGRNRFQGYTTAGLEALRKALYSTTMNRREVSLSFPEVTHNCSVDVVEDQSPDYSVNCTCSVLSDGYPRGTAQWIHLTAGPSFSLWGNMGLSR
ncbi:hypothetical protein RRG08_049648 [Elysia crispata]|uniref:Ig-like domain-containing protein n=1 Tax=Elysia crispata TaxID=231223 RepID=A0AAE1ED58_9GAST|nr:hypothetical protein RRG08_049648 [Elysia crispata]